MRFTTLIQKAVKSSTDVRIPNTFGALGTRLAEKDPAPNAAPGPLKYA